MVEWYSAFCSHHNEAISFYKDQLQNNKKLQILIRVSNQPFFSLWYSEASICVSLEKTLPIKTRLF